MGGYIKTDKTIPTMCGVGYFGYGNYKATFTDVDGKRKKTKQYDTWSNMMHRCYDEKFIQKNPTYKDAYVDPVWHNFQNFAEWFDDNYYEVEGQRMELDKDILFQGNKVYSPNTCIFVPHNINSLITRADSIRGDLPCGVSYVKALNKYRAYYNERDDIIHIGVYSSPNEAFLAYKKAKEERIYNVALEYKMFIPDKLFNALLNYEVKE